MVVVQSDFKISKGAKDKTLHSRYALDKSASKQSAHFFSESVTCE